MLPALAGALSAGQTLVVSSATLAALYRLEFARDQRRSGLRIWRTPDILPLDAWLERLWHHLEGIASCLPLAGPVREQALWESAIGDSGLLDVSAAATAARSTWRDASAWRIAPHAPEWTSTEDGSAFQRWLQTYQSELDDFGWADTARIGERLAADLAPRSPVWLAGFHPLPRGYAILADRIAPDSTLVAPAEDLPPVRADRFAGARDEAAAIAEWAARRRRADPSALLGIACPPAAAPEIQRALRDAAAGSVYSHFPAPASSEPALNAALLACELLRPRVPHARFSEILLSPFLLAPQEYNARALLDTRLRAEAAGLPTLDWQPIATHRRCPEAASRALAEATQLALATPQRQRPPAWIRTIERLLHILGWPGPEPLAPALAATWDDVLAGVSALDGIGPDWTADAALSSLNRIAARIRHRPPDHGQPIRIVPFADAAHAGFDHLWLAGMDAATWPPPANPPAFLPPAMARAAGIPAATAAGHHEWSRRITAGLLNAAAEVVASYSSGSGELPLSPSPLLLPGPPRDFRRRPRAVPAATTEISEPAAPALESTTIARGGTRALQLQSGCPFRAFAEVRLSARPLEEAALGLDPRERGTLLHRVMAILWSQIGDSSHLPEVDEAMIRAAVDQAIRESRPAPRDPFDARLQQLETERLVRLAGQWLELEKQRETPFAITGTEAPRTINLGPLTISGRIDRVDRLPDGSLVLLDYKTGESSPNKWLGDRPAEPQIPIYAASTTDRLAAVAYAQVRTGDIAFKGHALDNGILPTVRKDAEFTGRVEGWRTAVANLATEYATGIATVAPRAATECDRCHLHSLCRISELRP